MISSAISHHEFHHFTDFKQYFKKRPFDFDVGETAEQIHNTYKKIKSTATNSLLSQQATHSSLPLETNYPSPFGFFGHIDLIDDENGVKSNSFSDIPRIIDLSTGEPLESIPSVEQLQKNRKPKRPIELVENQDKLSNTFGIVEDKSSLSHKRTRTSKEYSSFIEEEEIDPNVNGPVINDTTFDKANSSNIKFTDIYQKAMARYMRSQLQHLNNEEYGNERKQMVLYYPRNNDYFRESFKMNVEDSQDDNLYEDHMDTD